MCRVSTTRMISTGGSGVVDVPIECVKGKNPAWLVVVQQA